MSDGYCLECHGEFAGRIREHTFHEPGTPGSHCYDCHMPRNIHNLVGGYLKLTRTHQMSSIPRPDRTLEMGRERSPNACDDCHGEEDPEWAAEWAARWWGSTAN